MCAATVARGTIGAGERMLNCMIMDAARGKRYDLPFDTGCFYSRDSKQPSHSFEVFRKKTNVQEALAADSRTDVEIQAYAKRQCAKGGIVVR
eukprot:scaffold2818_cov59-Cylindrotheca_fusiformis.AAC.2